MAKTTNNSTDLTYETGHPSDLNEKANRGRQAWHNFGLELRSITPKEVASLGLYALTLALIGWLLVRSGPALIPFVVGAILAYALLPVVNWLDRLMPRSFAALLSILTVLALLALFIALLIPALANQYERLVTFLPYAGRIQATVADLDTTLEDLPPPVREIVVDSFDQIVVDLRARMEDATRHIFQITASMLLHLINIVGAVLGLLVLPTWLLIVLTEQRKGVQAMDKVIPGYTRGDFWAIIRILDRSFRAFFQKQVTQGLLTGFLTFLAARALTVLGLTELEYPIIVALFVGLMELIPEIGPIVAVVVLGLAGLLISPATAIYLLGTYIVSHLLVSGYVERRAARRVREVHPAVLIVAVVALSELGLFWVLLSVPIVTASRDLFRYAYGRLSEPPMPAGLLPDEVKNAAVAERVKTPTVQGIPLAYRRGRAAQPSKAGKTSKTG